MVERKRQPPGPPSQLERTQLRQIRRKVAQRFHRVRNIFETVEQSSQIPLLLWNAWRSDDGEGDPSRGDQAVRKHGGLVRLQ